MKRFLIVSTLIFAGLSGWAWSQQRGQTAVPQNTSAQPQMQQRAQWAGPKWEYWTIVHSPDTAMGWLGALDGGKTSIPKESTINETLNLAGLRGWELVMVESLGGHDQMFYFKRPLRAGT